MSGNLNSDQQLRVLLIEGDHVATGTVAEMIANDPTIRVERVDSPRRATEGLGQEPPDIALLNLGRPHGEGLGALERLRKAAFRVPILVVGDSVDETVAADAVRLGAQDYLIHAELDSSRLRRALRAALERSRQRDALERKVEAERDRLRKIVDGSADGLLVVDRRNAIAFANAAAARLLGKPVEDLRGDTFDFPFAEDGEPSEIEVVSPEGRRSLAEMRAVEIEWEERPGTLVRLRNLTRRRWFETQLRQAQRMEAIGRLAGGMAHDFNNALTVMNGFAELVRNDLEPGNEMREDMGEIIRAGKSATALTRQLLAFTRQQVLQTQVLDLNEFVRDSSEFLGRTLREDMELSIRTVPRELLVRADVDCLQQILLNLALNSREAMTDGGRLEVETGHVELEREAFAPRFAVEPGSYVTLTVTDTGRGMDAKTREHVFEPYFTTKEDTKKSGLGLSTVYGIVKQSRGYIWIDSRPGEGTTVRLYLPEVKEDGRDPEASGRPSAGPHSAAKTVLLVEDDEAIRQLSSRFLAAAGFEVVTAADPAEALELCETGGLEPDLLITDMIMPGGNGVELAAAVRQRVSGTRVLYVSGYPADELQPGGEAALDGPFLKKPFRLQGLRRAVRQALGAETEKE